LISLHDDYFSGSSKSQHTEDADTQDHCRIANPNWANATHGTLWILNANSATGHDRRNDSHSSFPKCVSSRVLVRKTTACGSFTIASTDSQCSCISRTWWINSSAWWVIDSAQWIHGHVWRNDVSTWWISASTRRINDSGGWTNGRIDGSAKRSFESSIREFVAGPGPTWSRWKHIVTNEAISFCWSSSTRHCKPNRFWLSDWGGTPLSSWIHTSNGCFGTTSSADATCYCTRKSIASVFSWRSNQLPISFTPFHAQRHSQAC